MQIKSVSKIAIFALLAGAVGGAYVGSLGGRAYQAREDVKITRAAAIDHNCGAYDAKTGEFGWVRVVSAQDIIMGAVDEGQLSPAPAPKPAPSHPVPQRKPAHPRHD